MFKVTVSTLIKICVQYFQTGTKGHSKGLGKAARSLPKVLQKHAKSLIKAVHTAILQAEARLKHD